MDQQHAPTLGTDEELLRRFARGEKAALGLLAERFERPLLGLARGLLRGSDDLAMEAVQDTWVRVIGSAKLFAGRSTVKTWLYRITINRCHDLRQAGRLAVAAHLNGKAPAGPPVSQTESSEQLRAALETLPGERRLMLILCYHAGMSHPAAAEVLGIPVGTLKSRLAAALEELRSLCRKEENQ